MTSAMPSVLGSQEIDCPNRFRVTLPAPFSAGTVLVWAVELVVVVFVLLLQATNPNTMTKLSNSATAFFIFFSPFLLFASFDAKPACAGFFPDVETAISPLPSQP
jgi:hypothetical protein